MTALRPHKTPPCCSTRRVRSVVLLLRAAKVPPRALVDYPKVFYHDPANYTAPRLAYLQARSPGRWAGWGSGCCSGCCGMVGRPSGRAAGRAAGFKGRSLPPCRSRVALLTTGKRARPRLNGTLPLLVRDPSPPPGRAAKLSLVTILSRDDTEFAENLCGVLLEEYLVFKVGGTAGVLHLPIVGNALVEAARLAAAAEMGGTQPLRVKCMQSAAQLSLIVPGSMRGASAAAAGAVDQHLRRAVWADTRGGGAAAAGAAGAAGARGVRRPLFSHQLGPSLGCFSLWAERN